jgi:hypothetical protein
MYWFRFRCGTPPLSIVLRYTTALHHFSLLSIDSPHIYKTRLVPSICVPTFLPPLLPTNLFEPLQSVDHPTPPSLCNVHLWGVSIWLSECSSWLRSHRQLHFIHPVSKKAYHLIFLPAFRYACRDLQVRALMSLSSYPQRLNKPHLTDSLPTCSTTTQLTEPNIPGARSFLSRPVLLRLFDPHGLHNQSLYVVCQSLIPVRNRNGVLLNLMILCNPASTVHFTANLDLNGRLTVAEAKVLHHSVISSKISEIVHWHPNRERARNLVRQRAS